jgi:hypothetical protein
MLDLAPQARGTAYEAETLTELWNEIRHDQGFIDLSAEFFGGKSEQVAFAGMLRAQKRADKETAARDDWAKVEQVAAGEDPTANILDRIKAGYKRHFPKRFNPDYREDVVERVEEGEKTIPWTEEEKATAERHAERAAELKIEQAVAPIEPKKVSDKAGYEYLLHPDGGVEIITAPKGKESLLGMTEGTRLAHLQKYFAKDIAEMKTALPPLKGEAMEPGIDMPQPEFTSQHRKAPKITSATAVEGSTPPADPEVATMDESLAEADKSEVVDVDAPEETESKTPEYSVADDPDNPFNKMLKRSKEKKRKEAVQKSVDE